MLLCALLIEDSQTFRDGLIPALHDMAAVEVIAVAETARDAVAALGALPDRWQLAVVDLVLREGSGLDVLRAMERRLAHQRVVVLTNYATPEMRERVQRLGADVLFDKFTEMDAFFEWCTQLHCTQGASGRSRAAAPPRIKPPG
ncbi:MULTISPECIES: response regulator transcription factor [unclassified Variovorax]|uniref:response regulator transcription factor n=1 Tax=unclassified Variovorax TaxID=663243 RepID=UPI0008C1740E|nr:MULTISPECIES: response regulator [unclassified Variovorax]SEK16540.1 Response regulator receiver domain-containing protein [Variovorax sp. OK202]SFE52046.1 Response regulator receiver domain-containing protein [Variovorax sp. OK212]